MYRHPSPPHPERTSHWQNTLLSISGCTTCIRLSEGGRTAFSQSRIAWYNNHRAESQSFWHLNVMMGRSSHSFQEDERGALERLPHYDSPTTLDQRATGTDSKPGPDCDGVLRGASGHNSVQADTITPATMGSHSPKNARTGGGAAERAGLENRFALRGNVGSNPTLSAFPPRPPGCPPCPRARHPRGSSFDGLRIFLRFAGVAPGLGHFGGSRMSSLSAT